MKLSKLVERHPELLNANIELSADLTRYSLTLIVPQKLRNRAFDDLRIKREAARKLLDHLEKSGYTFDFSFTNRVTIARRTNALTSRYHSLTGVSEASEDDAFDYDIGRALAAARCVEFWDSRTRELFFKVVGD